MTPKVGSIYGLYHPLTGELRYVGQTWRTLNCRLASHLWDARRDRGSKRHVCAWIRALGAEGMKPKIMLLRTDIASQTALDLAESAYIRQARAQGCRLTNHTEGGGGCVGRRLTPEHLAKLHSPETRAKMAATKRGKPSLRKGAVLSVEQRKRISASKRGKRLRPYKELPIEGILSQLRSGVRVAEIASTYSVAPETVRRQMRRFGFESSLPKRGVSTEEVLRLLATGALKRQVAAKLGVDVATVYNHLNKAKASGVILPTTKRDVPTAVLISALTLNGGSRKRVAETLGLPLSFVYYRLRGL